LLEVAFTRIRTHGDLEAMDREMEPDAFIRVPEPTYVEGRGGR
jgi:hypothetical protein